ncbi:hypothetical protein ACFLZ7_02850 [Nanoarchaeota archaeon]
MDKEAIRKQAKKIMDDFVSALDKVKDIEESFGAERDEQTRDGSGKCPDSSEFRKRMIKNAPKVKDDCLLMEKKKW